jgi:exosortase
MGTKRSWWGTWIVLGALWAILIDQLSVDWEINPQYSYGWFVPLLTAYLFWSRWPSRPEPARPAGWTLLLCATIAVALAFFPTRLIREAAPDWSAVSWSLALQTVALTLAAIAWMGGWNSVRHFAWPICFFLLGVAWPVRFESAVTQGLMQHLAALTAELLGWAGVPALAQGNLLRLSTGVVGVDEACSGVRSLQSMLMASLFLGELNRLPWFARIALVVAGLAIALFFNVVRALVLVTVAIRDGLEAIDKWHDPAGFSILAASFVALCLMVKILNRSPEPFPSTAAARHPWRPLSARIWVPAIAWLATAELATEAWYRSHESPSEARLGWSVRWPETHAEFKDREIAPNVRAMLAYNEGREAAWLHPDGSRWLMFAFKWYAARTSTLSARQHRPEICLPAGGRTLLAEHPPVVIKVGELQIPFRAYEFDSNGEPLHVFFCLWEVGNRDFGTHLRQDFSRESRLQRVFAGQRNLGQQSLEVIISGTASRADAEAAFRAQMQSFLVLQRS